MKDLDDMDDESRRFRSPVYKKAEVETLVELVSKYKTVILNKSTTTAASQVKDAAWANIASAFNKKGFQHIRTSNMLKNKWENLKKIAKNFSNNVDEDRNPDYHHITEQVVALLMECNELRENNPSNIPHDILDNINSKQNKNPGKSVSNSESNDFQENMDEQNSEDESYGDLRDKAMRVRATNFTPEECSVLLKCVRPEKSAVFCNKNDSMSNIKRIEAWKRVTQNYNKLSPKKRTGDMLMSKFKNMRKTAKKIGLSKTIAKKIKLDLPCDLPFKSIKNEPLVESDDDNYLSEDFDQDMMFTNKNRTMESDHNHQPDPLTIVNQHSDSGNPFSSSSLPENSDVTKKKIELLNYKLETASMDRKRLEQVIKAETMERENRMKEAAMRLRATRLEVVAAEMKLPENHPALIFTPEELPAREYLQY